MNSYMQIFSKIGGGQHIIGTRALPGTPGQPGTPGHSRATGHSTGTQAHEHTGTRASMHPGTQPNHRHKGTRAIHGHTGIGKKETEGTWNLRQQHHHAIYNKRSRNNTCGSTQKTKHHNDMKLHASNQATTSPCNLQQMEPKRDTWKLPQDQGVATT